MPSPPRAASLASNETFFNGRVFFRLCAWASAAMLALVLAVAAGRTELGSQRFRAAVTAIFSAPDERDPDLSRQIAALSTGVEREMQRQAEMIRVLAMERGAAAERVAGLERQVNELGTALTRTTARLEADLKTAQQVAAAAASAASAARMPPPREEAPPAAVPTRTSSGREPSASLVQAAAAAREAPPATTVPPPANAPAAIAAAAPTHTGSISNTPSAGSEATGPSGMIRPFPTQQGPNGHATAARSPLFPSNPLMTTGIFENQIEPGAISTEFGVDLGPASTIDALRTRWSEIKASQSPLFDNLRPLVVLKDGGRSGQQLHLVAGPFANTAASARLCAVLSGSGITCRASVYEGQHLLPR